MKNDRKKLTKVLGVSDDVISEMKVSKDEEKAMRKMQTGRIRNMDDVRKKYEIKDFLVRCKLEAMAATWKRRAENNKDKDGEER